MSELATFAPDAEQRMMFNMQMSLLDNNDLMGQVRSVLNELVALIREGVRVSEMPQLVAPSVPMPDVIVEPAEIDLRAITDILIPVLQKQDLTQQFQGLTNRLDEFLKQITAKSGISGQQSWTNLNTRVMESKLDNITHKITDYEERLDYDGPNPIYIGKAPQGTDPDTDAWYIEFLEYSGGNPVRIQRLFNVAWNNRTSLDWS